ncbi:HXXEE domain-containing protein [Brevibacillus daliensis]|uniref:HXXEE domain-containing protein n=1 Tax=Brevibacillus daliensis TaxID=2892995 RepID=UPI001E3C2245|nr:HXXEE domain-containing protein [Brevibacillus daliensis]
MKTTDPYNILWLLPFIFALHNYEEYYGLFITTEPVSFLTDNFLGDLVGGLYDRDTFLVAIIFLSVSVALLVILEYLIRNRVTFELILLVTAILLVNGLSHIIQAIIFFTYVPGLITAVLLLIPYMSYLLYVWKKQGRINRNEMGRSLLKGAVFMVPIIVGILLLSKFFV